MRIASSPPIRRPAQPSGGKLRPVPAARTWLGLVLWLAVVGLGLPSLASAAGRGLVDLGPADDPFANCAPIAREGPERWASYRCILGVGRRFAKLDEAAAALDAILAENPTDGAALSMRSSVAIARAEPNFIDWLRRATAALDAEGDTKRATYARLLLADYLLEDDPLETEQLLNRAIKDAKDSGDPNSLAATTMVWSRLTIRGGGDLAEVEHALDDLHQQVMQSKDHTTRTEYLAVRSSLAFETGRDDEVVAANLERLRLAREIGDATGEAKTFSALVHALSNDPEQAQRVLGMSISHAATWNLELARRAESPWQEMNAESLLAALHMGSEEQRLARCREIALRVGNDVDDAYCLSTRAFFRLPHDPEAAFRDIDEAIEKVQTEAFASLTFGFQRLVMLWRTAPREEALAASLRYLDVLDHRLDNQRHSLTRARVRANYQPLYFWLADSVLESAEPGPTDRDIDLYLTIIERLRAREIMLALDARPQGVAPDDPRRLAHTAASQSVSDVQRQLLDYELDDAAREELMVQLRHAEGVERSAWSALVGADPALARAERSPPPPLAELQHWLRDDEAILSFQLGVSLATPDPTTSDTRSRVAVITRDTVELLDLPPRDEIEPLVDLFGGLFEARDGSDRTPAAGLYRALLAEALEGLPAEVEHLMLLPDGPLHRLAFAALRPSPDAPPLVERYRISEIPSLGLWLRLRRSDPREHRNAALVLADPSLLARNDVAAPATARALSSAESFGRLPHAREEGEALVRRVGAGSELRVGDAATEAGLKAGDVEHFTILHLASHAVLDERFPERSAVLLAPGGPQEDGLLQSREIARLDLHGTLVVLASCRSASGTVVGGEGPVGLSHAFFQAGARVVVASLWRLRDDDAAEFFAGFYRHLGEGSSVAEAVRATQQERRKAGAPAAAWAGIVVLGDGELVPLPDRGVAASLGWWSLGLVLLLALGLGSFSGLRSGRSRTRAARPRPPSP